MDLLFEHLSPLSTTSTPSSLALYFFLFFSFHFISLVLCVGGWVGVLGKILTLDNIRKRNVIVMDGCGIYKKSRQFIDHLFLNCEIARDLWSSLFQLFDVGGLCLIELDNYR